MFEGLIDLASERIGGKVIAASDEFFAPKENLIKEGRGIFIPDKYTEHGKWMDGWETRRRRTPGHDWCLLQLGLPGIIRGINIDTSHFVGNHPPYASLEASARGNSAQGDSPSEWVGLLNQIAIAPDTQNFFPISHPNTPAQGWTHVRLNIFPDGGVARLRIYGEVVKDWSQVPSDVLVDLAALGNGGRALSCSDMFFSSMNNLLLPGEPLNMGDGWETKRRRGAGHDWVILQLGTKGVVQKIEVDTAFFKGNYPDRCSVEGTTDPAAGWMEILPEQKLKPDTKHLFSEAVRTHSPITHVRFNIFPDGGVARLRIWGNKNNP